MSSLLRFRAATLTTSILLVAAGCGGGDTSGTGGTGGTTITGGSGGTTTGGAGGTTITGGTGGAGGTTGGGGAIDPCADYMGQATQAELALSPFFDEESEVLAYEATGEVVADEHVYDRIVFDLSAIRATTPAVQNIHMMQSGAPSELYVGFDDVGFAAVKAGTYTAWNCANAWYGVKSIETPNATVHVTFEHRLNPFALALEYDQFPNTSLVGAVIPAGDGDDVCVSIEGTNLYHYVFDKGDGDCPAGCTMHTYWGFTTDGTSVTPLGTFTNQDPTPAWFTQLPDCTKWL